MRPSAYQQPRMTPAVKGLLVSIGVIYILQLSLSTFANIPMIDLFGFAPQTFFLKGWVWQIVTYPFLHGPPGHILFNALALFMLGADLEMRWGTKRFLMFYGICAIGGALLQSLVWAVSLVAFPALAGPLGAAPIIGASGALYGLFVGFGRLYGNAQILVMFIFPMKAKHFVALLAGIEIVSALFFNGSGVAHLVHLGGLATGFLVLLWRGNGLDGRGGFSFGRKRTLDREEVRRRLNLIVNRRDGDDEDDNKPGGGGGGGSGGKYPITWN